MDMRKAQQGKVWFVVGALLILFGVYISVFPVSTPPHLDVYFDVSNSSVVLLQTTAAYNEPMSMVQPYIQNLTTGNRTLGITALLDDKPILNQTYDDVGVGYDIIRTNDLAGSVPSGSNVTVIVQLTGSGQLLSTDRTSVVANPTALWLVMGVVSAIAGIVFIRNNLRYVRKVKSVKRKNPRAT